jgi:hypothetical protein
MQDPLPIDQVRIEHDDEQVRCGPATFTPSLNQLCVRFLDDSHGGDEVTYDLNSIPFKEACLLHDGSGRPTEYLIYNDWNALIVRYGAVPKGKQYRALHRYEAPRHVALSSDVVHASKLHSSACHPNKRIPLTVRVTSDKVYLELYHCGVPAYQFDVPIKRLPPGAWYTPRDSQGGALPVRLKRPMLASLFKVNRVDVEWLG